MVFSADNSILSIAKTLPPPLLILQQLSFHHSSNGRLSFNVAFLVVLVPSWHPPLLNIALPSVRRGGCQEGTNTTKKETLRAGIHRMDNGSLTAGGFLMGGLSVGTRQA
jgi:hypothetical protein